MEQVRRRSYLTVTLVTVAVLIPVLFLAVPTPRQGIDAGFEENSGRSRASSREPIWTVPSAGELDAGKVELGRRLFHDARLSGDGRLSCASCHDLDHAGIDGKTRTKIVDGIERPRNTPTVFNSSLNYRQLWDGSVGSLEAQVDGPLLDPNEMASSWNHVLGVLSGDASYADEFREIYGAIEADGVRDAIATFERSLVTTGSPFDRWLEGDTAALGENARRGYALFKDLGCASCHQGVNVGGNMFQRLGVMDARSGRGSGERLRVPPLRNVARTAPYFHDGSIETLGQAVRVMGRRQLGHILSDEQVGLLVAFLESLSGRTL